MVFFLHWFRVWLQSERPRGVFLPPTHIGNVITAKSFVHPLEARSCSYLRAGCHLVSLLVTQSVTSSLGTHSVMWQVVTHSGVAAEALCPLYLAEGVTDVSPPPQTLGLCCHVNYWLLTWTRWPLSLGVHIQRETFKTSGEYMERSDRVTVPTTTTPSPPFFWNSGRCVKWNHDSEY